MLLGLEFVVMAASILAPFFTALALPDNRLAPFLPGEMFHIRRLAFGAMLRHSQTHVFPHDCTPYPTASAVIVMAEMTEVSPPLATGRHAGENFAPLRHALQ